MSDWQSPEDPPPPPPGGPFPPSVPPPPGQYPAPAPGGYAPAPGYGAPALPWQDPGPAMAGYAPNMPDPNVWAGPPLASFGTRAAALFIDLGIFIGLLLVVVVLGIVSGRASQVIGLLVAGLGYIGLLVFSIWNTIWKQGTEGWTIGKQKMGIKVLRQDNGLVIGWPMALARSVVAALISNVTCGIGGIADYLWPLWDKPKKQRLTDKILSLVVVHA